MSGTLPHRLAGFVTESERCYYSGCSGKRHAFAAVGAAAVAVAAGILLLGVVVVAAVGVLLPRPPLLLRLLPHRHHQSLRRRHRRPWSSVGNLINWEEQIYILFVHVPTTYDS